MHAKLLFRSSMSGKSESEEWWFDVRPKGMRRKRPCPIDELCSGSSLSQAAHPTQRQPDGTTQSRHVLPWHSQPVGPKGQVLKQKGPRCLGGDLMHEREIYRCPRSECRSEGRHCFAGNSRDARLQARHRPQGNDRPVPKDRSAPGPRCHRRPRYRPPSRCWHRRPCHQPAPCFLERKAGADALASRAQEASRKRKQKGALRPTANAERRS